MPIYKTASGWQIKVQRNGYRFVDFVKGLDNHQRAKEIEAGAISDMTRGTRPTKGKVSVHGTSLTLQNLFEDALVHIWPDVSDSYLRHLLGWWRRDYKVYFEHKMGIYTLDKVDTLAIDGFITWLETTPSRPNGHSTINNKLNILSSLFTRQLELGNIQSKPIIHWKPRGNNARLRFFSMWEEKKIQELVMSCPFLKLDAKKRMSDFFSVLIDTGMRPWMEAHQVRKSWLRYSNTGNRIIRIPVEFSKTNKERDIPIGGRTLDILLKYAKNCDADEALFSKLSHQSHVVLFWKEWLRPQLGWGAAEVPYCMRHTFATRLVECGVNLVTIQELMGHSKITQTAQYAKATDTVKEQSIMEMNNARIAVTNRVQSEDKTEDILHAHAMYV